MSLRKRGKRRTGQIGGSLKNYLGSVKKKKKLSKLQVEYSNGIKMSEVLDILSCKKYVFFHVPLNVYQDKRNMPTEIFQIPFTAI